MKSIWREILMAVLMAMMLPGILLNWPVKREMPELSLAEPEKHGEEHGKIRLQMKLRRRDGSVENMDMDRYLVGVILAEMPSTFEPEAKKAQAVAARTYARKAETTGGKHGDGSVCENPGCCQAYISPEEYLDRGGTQRAVDEAKTAAEDTSGLVLMYEGKLIEATYFSCSGGSTEDAVAVWGTDYPYLRAVDSPGEEYAVHHTDTVIFSKKELAEKLGLNKIWFGETTYTAGGGIHTMVIGGKTFKGTELRTKLGLRSTAFTITEASEEVTVTTRGFGHRVGMSQYGADAMALGGSNFAEILAHYYPGTSLELTNDRR